MIIEAEHFQYLSIQRGAISRLVRDEAAWRSAYEASIEFDLTSLKPFLPVRSILDIGSGLGGIDAAINQYSGGNCFLYLVDGLGDPPRVRVHRETFNNARVGTDFLVKNGVKRDHIFWEYPFAPVDLVISLQAWCFHFPPSEYIDIVGSAFETGATIVTDIRKDKRQWKDEMFDAFGQGKEIFVGRKSIRYSFADNRAGSSRPS